MTMDPRPLHQRDAATLVHQLHRREITAEALVRDCLERIEAREPLIHAWALLDPQGALDQARQRDRESGQGLLQGLPIGVKDIMDTRDMPTAYGSPLYSGNRPSRDAAAVTLARKAGAIVLGKTVTTEFAVFTPGPTVNPRNLAHTPGGSSSGSAAAVADCMVPLAFATQTGGSIIRPAAYCGIVGYKPSFNLMPRSGVQALADSLDTIGTLARSVRDAALFASAAGAAPDLLLPEACTDRPSVGLCRTWEWAHCEPCQQAALEAAGAYLAREGFKVKTIELPGLFRDLADAHYTIMLRQQYLSLATERIHHWSRLSENLRTTLNQGGAVSEARYHGAVQLVLTCQQAIRDLFAQANVDVLLVPSVTGEAPEGLAYTGNPIMNRIWTALHGPAITLPFGNGPRGLPTAVCVAGLQGDDRLTLLAAQAIEAALAHSPGPAA
jgi:Asp-tRNA(Asn)/Glu-tRNA(Gln) amidotransferase A subunit family amidase